MTNVPGKRDLNRNALTLLNTNYKVFSERLTKHGKKSLFAAGLAFDRKYNALLVYDDQDGMGTKIWHKIPGGVHESVFTNEHYLYALELELKNYKRYSNQLISSIIDRENKKEKAGERNIANRTMILEIVEETKYFPVEFSYACDGFRFNKDSKQFDLWQTYFTIHCLISDNSHSIEGCVKDFHKVRTAIASDKDVKIMRVIVPIEELIAKLGPSTHKVATECILNKQAEYWNYRSIGADSPVVSRSYSDLSKRFAYASKMY